MVYGTFEADWAALDSKKKEKLALEGLYRGACSAPRDNSRVKCPEMTVGGLAGNGEYNLIRLVRPILFHEPALMIISCSSNASSNTTPPAVVASRHCSSSLIRTSTTRRIPKERVMLMR
jgi:hypothetical protein